MRLYFPLQAMKCAIPGLNVKGKGKFDSESKINMQYRLCMKFDWVSVDYGTL